MSQHLCWCGGFAYDLPGSAGKECVESEYHDPDADGRPKEIRKLYLAGPMSGYPESNYPAFNIAERSLFVQGGFEIVNPAKTAPKPRCSYTDLLREDLRGLLDCDGVATLDRWWESVGARNEVTVAGVLRMPVRSVEEWISCGNEYPTDVQGRRARPRGDGEVRGARPRRPGRARSA